MDQAQTWERRLQHVPMRTKLVVPMVALAVLPALGIGAFLIGRARESLEHSVVQRVAFDTDAKARAVEEFLGAVRQDLAFLSQINAIRELAGAESAGDRERVGALRRAAEQELLVFSQGKRAYYQIRYLNQAGHEVVRLNVSDGQPQIVPADQLQDKSDRYYVKAAWTRAPGQIYVSPIDLNVEHGRVELPARAVVRYATVVPAADGAGRGLLVINLHADYLLSLVGPVPSATEAWLIDEDNTYAGYLGASAARRNVYALENRRRLADDYAPGEVAAIRERRGGGLAMKTAAALLFGASIAVDDPASERHWTLLLAHPRAPIVAPVRRLTVFLSVVLFVVVAVAGLLGVLIAHYLGSPVASLRRATREIAAGDLSKRVTITTGDELEALAADFNTMTERLENAHQRLAAWNVELERAVAQQTDKVQQLQRGLARADKLASIGQVTAGVLHEVGSPLAAIKTKIQIAEKGRRHCPDCQTLLAEVVGEVDRLANFLRSFSRLGRPRERQMKQDVSLPDVATSVVRLFAPDLRRRHISLRCESADAVPAIRADADQLRQLIMNLILNAADASPDGGEVVVRIQGRTDAAVVEVSDHGAGIPAEIVDKIWNPFFTTKPEGTGLGLAIARQIVQDYGGTIHIQSEPGNGTVVTVRFPLEPK